MNSHHLSFADAIILSGVIYGLILSISLYRSAKKLAPNYFLALLIIAFTLLNWRIVLLNANLSESYQWLIKSSFVTVTLIPPALYLYIKGIVIPHAKPQLIPHFVPFGIHFLYQLSRFLPDNTIPHEGGQWAGRAVTLVLIIQLFYYFFHSVRLIKRYDQEVRNQFSEIGAKSLKSLKVVFIGTLSVFLIWAVGYLYFERIIDFKWLFISISGLIYGFGSERYRYGFIPPLVSINEKILDKDPEIKLKAEALQQKVYQDRLFLQNQFQISELAAHCQVTPREASYLLNKGLGKSFYQLINEMRIAEVCKRLNQSEYAHLTILGIALDCGFSSKSSFNAIFKELTGISPREFKKIPAKRSEFMYSDD